MQKSCLILDKIFFKFTYFFGIDVSFDRSALNIIVPKHAENFLGPVKTKNFEQKIVLVKKKCEQVKGRI